MRPGGLSRANEEYRMFDDYTHSSLLGKTAEQHLDAFGAREMYRWLRVLQSTVKTSQSR